MADNTTLNSMSGGDVIAADDISSVKYQRIKLVLGAEGANDGDVAITNPLPIAGKTGDATLQVPRIDVSTHSLQVIDYAHHEIHAGSHFFYTDKVTLASAGTQDYLITTPDTAKYAHLIFMATGSAITTVDIYEGSDKTGTSAQTARNSNRNSSTEATTTIHKGTSGGTTDGTLIWTMQSGSATSQSRAGLTTDRNEEIVLKRNTKYIIRFTSGTAANLCNLQLDWYEHTDKSA